MAASLGTIEPDLKKVLYRCLEDVQATKAALYLSEDGKPYELSASYGFNDSLRKQVNGNDPVVERLVLRKAPFFVNGLMSEQRFHEILYHTDSERMLVVPLFVRGQLIGFVDMRDKAGGVPFKNDDLEPAHAITQDFFKLFAKAGLFGQTPVNATVEEPFDEVAGEGSAPVVPVSKIIQFAEQIVSRELATGARRSKILTETEISPIEAVLPSILSVPTAVLAAFSAFGHLGNIQPVAARATITDEALRKFDDKLRGWLRKQGSPVQAGLTRTKMIYPFGTGGSAIQPGQLASILSAPVEVAGIPGLVLSIGFESTPDRDTQMHLANFLKVVEQTILRSISHASLGSMRQRAAQRLVEPDFYRYPELVEHAQRVSEMADQFAHELGLPDYEMEEIRIAGLVHDVGMRVLDYQRLYRKQKLTQKEVDLIKQHPMVGAALIAESPLGPDIARLVLSHHERPDGKGYPRGMTAGQIPRGSLILHLCEAFDAMTATESYQPRMPESTALLQISRGAGAQFDADLAHRFVAMLGGV